MTKKITFSYTYFLTRVFFIGFGFSFLFNIAGKDAWISFLIGHLLSLLLVIYINKLKKQYAQKQFLKEKGHNFLKIIIALFATLISVEILFIFQTLASNFFLVKSPHYFILLPALLLAYRICQKNFTTISRVSTILMTISLSMVIIALFVLTGYVKKDNFMPVLTKDFFHIIQASIYYVAYSTAPLVFLILLPNTDNNLPKHYIKANLTIIIMGILIIGILGPDLINIYRYPEYMILKVIKILNFIEKVENIFAIATLFDLFMALSISLNIIKEKLPKKKQNLSFIAILLIIFALSIFLGIYYSIALQIYYYLPVILLIFIFIILLTLSLKLKKLTSSHSKKS